MVRAGAPILPHPFLSRVGSLLQDFFAPEMEWLWEWGCGSSFHGDFYLTASGDTGAKEGISEKRRRAWKEQASLKGSERVFCSAQVSCLG